MIEDHYCYIDKFNVCENKHHMETDKTMQNFNADGLMVEFVKKVNDMSSKVRTNHVMIPWGCDFDYNVAQEDFRYAETLIDYINKNNK
jgi:hypothetical protein